MRSFVLALTLITLLITFEPVPAFAACDGAGEQSCINQNRGRKGRINWGGVINCVVGQWSAQLATTVVPAVASGDSCGVKNSYANTNAVCLPAPPFWGPVACSVQTPCCSASSAKQIIADAFDAYRECFIMDRFYNQQFLELGLKPLSSTVSAVTIDGAVLKGKAIDGANLMATTLAIQKQNVKTNKDYAVSESVCRFGTLTRALAASDIRVTANQLVLSEAGLARNLGGIFSVGASGRGDDNYNRLKNFVTRFCDINDNNNGLDEVCITATPISDKYHNRDIDYTRSIDTKPTLNANFTDATFKEDEANVFELANTLYGHQQPKNRPSLALLKDNDGAIEAYNEYRSIIARRAAAQNSFAAITALRSAGSGASDQYIKTILSQLGLSAGDIDNYAYGKNGDANGAQSNASYNEQMEILTKKIYQDPAFYARLMEGAANVKRSSAAMGGIGLMQDRDIYKSTTRSEMLLALLVELEARKIANNVHSDRVK